jgi:DNA polymerase-3 subunit delta
MKLTYLQLEAHLKKKLAPLYVVAGEEIFLKQEAITAIRRAAQQAGFSERVHLAPEKGFAWDMLYAELHTTSLMAQQRMIELDLQQCSMPKVGDKILQDYCQNPLPHNLLLLETGKIDSKLAKSAWLQACEKQGVIITIWPLPREQYPQWLMQRAKNQHLTLTLDIATQLASYVEGNLIAAAQAIEKLSLLATHQVIDHAMIRAIFSDDSRFIIFDFIDSLIANNPPRALHILNTLREEGIELPLLLWGITRELRLLMSYAREIVTGISYDALFKKYRIYSGRQMIIRNFLKKFTLQDMQRLLCHAAELDRSIKGASTEDPWQVLQLFCLRVSN